MTMCCLFNDGFIFDIEERYEAAYQATKLLRSDKFDLLGCKWSAMVCRPVCNWSAIGLQLLQTGLHGLQICVEHDRQNNVTIAIFIPIE